MTVVVSLLRGVNVGGHKKINMAALRALYESLGLRDPQTYIQSGNAVFRTEEPDLMHLAKRIENEIERSFGIHSDVVLRTASELRAVIARNPFADRPDIDPAKLAVTFLASDPGEEARDKIRGMKFDPEEVRIEGSELYIYFPNGMGRSKLSQAGIDKALKTPGTARNWNTVSKLLDIAESFHHGDTENTKAARRKPFKTVLLCVISVSSASLW